MIRLGALVALLFATVPQDSDLPERVHKLVEQVRSDDLQTADDACTGLVRLGAEALAALKAEFDKASGDTKLRIEAAMQAIQRNIRRERAMGTPVLVTLKAEALPLDQVLEELKKLTGQPLVWREIPADPVSITLERASYWDALDAICKVHGGVMWSITPNEVQVAKGPYRERLRVTRGNLMLSFTRLTISNNLQIDGGGTSQNMSLQGAVSWTAGSGPSTMTVNIERMEDDKGTGLVPRDRGMMPIDPGKGDPRSISRAVNHWSYVLPDEAATKIAILKGTLTVKYVLETKKLMSVPNPAAATNRSIDVEPYSISIESFNLTGRSVTALVRISQSGRRFDSPITAGDFAVVDKDGKSWTMNGYISGRSIGGNQSSSTYQLNLMLPEKVEIASLDLTSASDTEEVPVPFEFRDLGIK
jgi:hypothetical protein